jgi:hypothetical protein
MRVRRNLDILSQDRTLKDAGRCDQQLVGWIAMEGWRQLGGFHYDPRVQVQKRDAGFREGAFYPQADGAIELQPSALHELCNFPTGDDADAKDALYASFE